MLSPPSSSQLLYSVRPPLMLYCTLPLMPTVPSSWPGLVHDAGRQVHELREVASVQLELLDLLARNGCTQRGRRRFHLRDALARDHNFFRHRADRQWHVNANLRPDVEHDTVRRVFLEAGGCDRDVVASTRQTRNHVRAVRIGRRRLRRGSAHVRDHHRGVRDRRARLIRHRAADVAGILCGRFRCAERNKELQEPTSRRRWTQPYSTEKWRDKFPFTFEPPVFLF